MSIHTCIRAICIDIYVFCIKTMFFVFVCWSAFLLRSGSQIPQNVKTPQNWEAYRGKNLRSKTDCFNTHTIHVWYIFTHIWLMFMVNERKSSIHGCYGILYISYIFHSCTIPHWVFCVLLGTLSKIINNLIDFYMFFSLFQQPGFSWFHKEGQLFGAFVVDLI